MRSVPDRDAFPITPEFRSPPRRRSPRIGAGRGWRGRVSRCWRCCSPAGAALALYHSGVEWKLFPGPSDCAGTLAKAASTEEFLRQLQTVKPVRCDEPALFVLGLTLANWNAMISLALAAVAGVGARRAA